jgi:hypothetical protein
MGKNYFNGTDAELYTGAQNFASIVTEGPGLYGLTSTQAAAITALSEDYSEKYLAAINPTTRTKAAIAAKNLSRKNLCKMASDLAQIVQATPSVTDEMKIVLGLNVHKQPASRQRPTARPGVDLISVVERDVNVHIHDIDSITKRGKPADVEAAWVYSFVGPEYPSDPSQWTFEGSTSKANYKITFPNSLPGGTQVWICAAWINAKQEAGPTSVPITTNLQGGGSSSEEGEIKIAA